MTKYFLDMDFMEVDFRELFLCVEEVELIMGERVGDGCLFKFLTIRSYRGLTVSNQ